MNPDSQAGLVRKILECLRCPEKLNEHPWVSRRFVQEFVINHPAYIQKEPGYQLAFAAANLYTTMIPGSPPKRGKRLDTHWGAFGILGAQYFAPFLFGVPYPSSLRDAWGMIDSTILLFRFGPERIGELSEVEKVGYKLIGDELNISPMSTISDWHLKGIEKLGDVIQDREQHLTHHPSGEIHQSFGAGEEGAAPTRVKKKRKWQPWVSGALGLVLIVALILAGLKMWKVYQLAVEVRRDLSQAKNLVSLSLGAEEIESAGVLLDKTCQDIDNLRLETSPYLRLIGPLMHWVPVYGEDIAASADLLEMADQAASSVRTVYRAAEPIVSEMDAGTIQLSPQKIAALLVQVQPELIQASQELDSAMEYREKFDAGQFSPRTQRLVKEVDPLLNWLNNGLSVAVVSPTLLGASSDGPKTYLVLIQNEDELRATGGFITALATFVVKDGDIFGFKVEDSGDQENWELPYPNAPWQLRQYMNSPVLVLRDANWFTDYPTTAGWVEYLYAYTHQHSVDGIIAIDQQFLVELLKVIGPLTIEDVEDTITSGNVISYMRAAKTPPVNDRPPDWYRKQFISQIGNAIIERLMTTSEEVDWRKLTETMVRTLNERHLLLQFDDPQISAVLADMEWDGAVKPGDGDFLMLVNSNVGFNKANAAVQSSIRYEIDLSQTQYPTGALTVSQTNESPSTRSCIQFGGHVLEEARYPIYYCYYDYLRVYVPSGSQLADASPRPIPADWMVLKNAVPARVDTLEEDIAGIQAFGTLVVVPGGQTRETRFTFALPARVVSFDPGTNQYTYRLKIKKQPGMPAIPATIQIHLPPSAHLDSANLKTAVDGTSILIETDLRTDVVLEVLYSLP